jgi:hypothetical protein
MSASRATLPNRRANVLFSLEHEGQRYAISAVLASGVSL